MTRVLVTGGHGLIGSWLVKALLGRGDAVTVLSRGRRPGSALTLEGSAGAVELVEGELLDGALIERTLGAGRIELVFHLAGQTIVGAAGRAPAATFETNVKGTWTVLEACRSATADARVVVASSEKVYGPSPVRPCTEQRALDAAYPYDASKAAADVIARSYWSSYGMRVAVTRFANVYGGGDMNASRLVPEAVWAALGGRRPVIRSDGTAERDFLYVEDAVAAYLAIADALGDAAQGAGGAAFNAGGGGPQPVLEVVRLVFAAAGVPFEPDIRGTGTPAGELAFESVDHSRLADLTGWRPRVDLAEGLRRTVAWYRAHAPTPPSDAGRATP
ncbi:MAG TPA: NAD-dependent epimerase/dehydratase family protein [Solirubrobacteraceae bacterium]|nr:NAD-dependent epimerase/dehydratase family protein [Solirubrobacteraceae bacterium]